MTDNVAGSVSVKITADLGSAEKDLPRVEAAFNKTADAAQKLDPVIQKMAQRVGVSYDTMAQRVADTAAKFASGASVIEAGSNKVTTATDAVARQAQTTERAIRGLTAAFIVRGIEEFAKAIIDVNEQIAGLGDTAKRIGANLQDFQKLRLAAQGTGLGGPDVDSGVTALGKAIDEAVHGETTLGKLFADNGLKLKDQAGNAIGVKEALADVANLVRDTSNEFGKIKIAEAAGLTEDWVKFLNQGADGIARAGDEAARTGTILDDQVVKKAQQFQDEWNKATASWSTNLKAALEDIRPLVKGIIDLMIDVVKAVAALSSFIEKYGPGPMGGAIDTGNIPGLTVGGNMAGSMGAGRQSEIADSNAGLTVDVRSKPKQPNLSSLYDSKDKSDDSDSETTLQRVTREIEQQTKVLNEQTAAIGQGTYAKADSTTIQKLLNAALKDGDDIGTKFKTAQDLLAASSANLTPEMAKQRDAIIATADAYAKAQVAAEKAAEEQKRLQDLNKFTQDTFSGILKDTLSNLQQGQSFWKAFENAGVSALNRIADKLIDMAVSDLFTNAFGGGKNGGGLWGALLGTGGGSAGIVGSLFGGGASVSAPTFGFASPTVRSASGHIFDTGGVTPFALGGAFSNSIVNRPTLFKFASGTGLMGEAGPEAIMPLKRGADGSLGIAAHGTGASNDNGPSVNFAPVYNIDARGADQAAVQRIQLGLDKTNAELKSNIIKTVRNRHNENW